MSPWDRAEAKNPAPYKKIAALLAEKLTKEELVELWTLVDEDFGDNLWEALAEEVDRVAPEVFE